MRASSSNSRGPGGPEGPGGGVGATTPSIHGSITCFSPIQPEATLSASTRRCGGASWIVDPDRLEPLEPMLVDMGWSKSTRAEEGSRHAAEAADEMARSRQSEAPDPQDSMVAYGPPLRTEAAQR